MKNIEAISNINSLLENYFEIFQSQEVEEKQLVEGLEAELQKKKAQNDMLEAKLNSITKNVKLFVESISSD